MIKNFWTFIPRKISSIEKFRAFFEKAKTYYDNLILEILKIKWYRNPSLTPFPEQQGFQEGSYYLDRDPRRSKRQAIFKSRPINRRPTAFVSWKPVIDLVTGGDSSIWRYAILRDPFILAKTSLGNTPLGTDSSMLTNNFTLSVSKLGIDTLGSSYVASDDIQLIARQYGSVYIDLGVIPTNEQLNELQDRLAYLRSGFYVIYFGIGYDLGEGEFILGVSILGMQTLGVGKYFRILRRL